MVQLFNPKFNVKVLPLPQNMFTVFIDIVQIVYQISI
jgi:hypothetical protein